MAQAYYHLVQAAEWQEAKQSGEPYVPRTYESDGALARASLAGPMASSLLRRLRAVSAFLVLFVTVRRSYAAGRLHAPLCGRGELGGHRRVDCARAASTRLHMRGRALIARPRKPLLQRNAWRLVGAEDRSCKAFCRGEAGACGTGGRQGGAYRRRGEEVPAPLRPSEFGRGGGGGCDGPDFVRQVSRDLGVYSLRLPGALPASDFPAGHSAHSGAWRSSTAAPTGSSCRAEAGAVNE